MKFIDAVKVADTMTPRTKYSYPCLIPAFTDAQSPAFLAGFYRLNDKMTYCENFTVVPEYLEDGIVKLDIVPEKYDNGPVNVMGQSWWVCEVDFRIHNERDAGGEVFYTSFCHYSPVENGGYTVNEWMTGEKDVEEPVVEDEEPTTEDTDDASITEYNSNGMSGNVSFENGELKVNGENVEEATSTTLTGTSSLAELAKKLKK